MDTDSITTAYINVRQLHLNELKWNKKSHTFYMIKYVNIELKEIIYITQMIYLRFCSKSSVFEK